MDSQGGILHCLAGIHVTPGLFLAAFVACGVFLLALWVYRQSDFYGRGFFLLSQAAMLWWLACALLEIAVSGPQCKIFFAKACWPAIGLLPAAWALFNRRYAHSIDAPVAGWERLAVLAGPLLLSAAAFTNGWHGLFYAAGTGPLSDAPGAPVRYVHGPLFYLGALCLYGFLSWSVVTVARGAFAAPRLHRLRFLTLLAITCLAIGANLGYILFGFTLLGFDPTPFSFLSISLLFCWLIISDEFFSILPAGNRALLERLDDPVLFLDRRGRLVEANPAARRLSTDSAARQSLARFRCPEVEALVREMLQGADLRALPELLDVGARHYQVTASALEKPLGGGETGGWMLLLKDITRVRQQALALEQALRLSERRLEAITEMHRALKSQVDVDPLTGLLNRRGLDAVLERLGPEAPARAPVVVVIDIDHFKRINDSHGHAAGDEVLRGFSDFLRGRFGHGDTLCRIGGEEFVLVMPGTGLTEAHRRVEAARRALAGTAFAGGPMPLRVSFSAGLAAWGPDGESFDEVFARADTRLYAAKSAGRNRSVLSDREPA